MGFSVARQTLYAQLSAIEEDLRALIALHLNAGANPENLFGQALYDSCKDRLQKDTPGAQPSVTAMLAYLDFADSFQLLNKHSSQLPKDIATYIKVCTRALEKLIPIRNRVAHIRPINFDDVVTVQQFCTDAVQNKAQLWQNLSATIDHLRVDPSFPMGLEIPRFTDTTKVKHNLPIPDFDETGFIGRQEQIGKLKTHLLGPYPVVTVVGEGGLGKTALAVKVAYDILDDPDCPYDAIVWTTSKTTILTPSEIRRIEGAISDSLGLFQDVANQLGPTGVTDPMSEILAYLQEFRILLVLDNLETVLDQNIRDFLARLPTGSKVIITSRIGIGAYEVPIKLEPMDESESVQLVRTLATGRDVQSLQKIPTSQLRGFCRRMSNNPGYIKWFVTAVQTGRRPEEILADPRMFLDFCMSNVYRYISEQSRQLLRCLVCVPGRFSQAELAFLNKMEALDIRKCLQELLTTNMIYMISIPLDTSFQTVYDVSELARKYLLEHHPIQAEESKSFNSLKQQLMQQRDSFNIGKDKDSYDINKVKIRSFQDIVVAKFLQNALVEVQRRNLEEADRLVATAREFAPDYFEVHRVDALIKAKYDNFVSAREAYEKAIDLEPNYAPLRRWYGGSLLYYGEVDSAQVQFAEARRLDPNSVEVQMDMARTHLYLKQYSEAAEMLAPLLTRAELPIHLQRKIWDYHLQYHYRRADDAIEEHDEPQAIESSEAFMHAFEDCPDELRDSRMLGRLDKLDTVVWKCLGKTLDTLLRRRAETVKEWIQYKRSE